MCQKPCWDNLQFNMHLTSAPDITKCHQCKCNITTAMEWGAVFSCWHSNGFPPPPLGIENLMIRNSDCFFFCFWYFADSRTRSNMCNKKVIIWHCWTFRSYWPIRLILAPGLNFLSNIYPTMSIWPECTTVPYINLVILYFWTAPSGFYHPNSLCVKGCMPYYGECWRWKEGDKTHLFASIALGQHDHASTGGLECIHVAVHTSCRSRSKRSTGIAL